MGNISCCTINELLEVLNTLTTDLDLRDNPPVLSDTAAQRKTEKVESVSDMRDVRLLNGEFQAAVTPQEYFYFAA